MALANPALSENGY